MPKCFMYLVKIQLTLPNHRSWSSLNWPFLWNQSVSVDRIPEIPAIIFNDIGPDLPDFLPLLDSTGQVKNARLKFELKNIPAFSKAIPTYSMQHICSIEWNPHFPISFLQLFGNWVRRFEVLSISWFHPNPSNTPHWNIPASPHAKIFPQTYPSQPPQTQQVAGMYWRLGSIDSHTNNRQSHTQLSPLLFAFTPRSCHLMKWTNLLSDICK